MSVSTLVLLFILVEARLAINKFKILGSISTAEGSSLARVGDTTVVCGVKAEITEPELSTPNDGFIGDHPNMSLLIYLLMYIDH